MSVESIQNGRFKISYNNKYETYDITDLSYDMKIIDLNNKDIKTLIFILETIPEM